MLVCASPGGMEPRSPWEGRQEPVPHPHGLRRLMPHLVLMVKWALSPSLGPRLPALRAQGPFCREPHGCPQGLPCWAQDRGGSGAQHPRKPPAGSAILLPSRPRGWSRSLMSLKEAGSSWRLLGPGSLPSPNPGRTVPGSGKEAAWASPDPGWVTLDKSIPRLILRPVNWRCHAPLTPMRMHSPQPSVPSSGPWPWLVRVLTQGRGKRRLVTSKPFFTGTVTRLGSTRWAAMRSSSRLSDISLGQWAQPAVRGGTASRRPPVPPSIPRAGTGAERQGGPCPGACSRSLACCPSLVAKSADLTPC